MLIGAIAIAIEIWNGEKWEAKETATRLHLEDKRCAVLFTDLYSALGTVRSMHFIHTHRSVQVEKLKYSLVLIVMKIECDESEKRIEQKKNPTMSVRRRCLNNIRAVPNQHISHATSDPQTAK